MRKWYHLGKTDRRNKGTRELMEGVQVEGLGFSTNNPKEISDFGLGTWETTNSTAHVTEGTKGTGELVERSPATNNPKGIGDYELCICETTNSAVYVGRGTCPVQKQDNSTLHLCMCAILALSSFSCLNTHLVPATWLKSFSSVLTSTLWKSKVGRNLCFCTKEQRMNRSIKAGAELVLLRESTTTTPAQRKTRNQRGTNTRASALQQALPGGHEQQTGTRSTLMHVPANKPCLEEGLKGGKKGHNHAYALQLALPCPALPFSCLLDKTRDPVLRTPSVPCI